jgi:hypothetical protein
MSQTTTQAIMKIQRHLQSSPSLLPSSFCCWKWVIATIFIISFDGLQECCDGTLIPGTTKNEEIWDKVFFWLAVAYLGLVVIEIPLVVMECSAAAFNPLIGILLTVVSLYNTKKTELLIMYGLVTAASIGENYALWQD